MAMRRTLQVITRRNGALLQSASVVARQASSSSDLPKMPPCDFQPQPYTHMSFMKMLEIRKKHLNPGIMTFYKNPVLIHQGHMQWLFDNNGKRYLDLFAGIATVNCGHCHPKITERAKRQMDKLWHTTNIYMHPTIHEYAEKLAEKLPGNLKVVYFTNSGSEANDLAMFMARLHTGSFDVIGHRNAYHGSSPYIMGMTAIGSWNFQVPGGFGIHQTMNPDVYRGIWGGYHCRDSISQPLRTCNCHLDHCEAADHYANQLSDVLNHTLPKRVAAFFAEPIQGVGGTVQYPKGYLRRAFEIVRESKGLCIVDEVQTGFGRTGSHYWGFEAHGVLPDIVTMAKGIGNGFPLAAVVTTPEIAQTMSQALHFNTFGGNPIACAVGHAVLDVIDEEGLMENASKVGGVFIKELMQLREEFEVIGDVRGKGLMLGVELVKDRETREALPAEDMMDIWEECKDLGILLGKGGLDGNTFRIKPPLCIEEQDVHFAVAVLRKALQNYEKKTK